MLDSSKWKLEKSFRIQICLSHTKSKIRNTAKQKQLNNCSLTDPSQMFKDDIMAPSPIPNPIPQALSPIPLQWFQNHLQTLACAQSPSNASDSNSNKNFVTKGQYSSTLTLNSLISDNLKSCSFYIHKLSRKIVWNILFHSFVHYRTVNIVGDYVWHVHGLCLTSCVSVRPVTYAVAALIIVHTPIAKFFH